MLKCCSYDIVCQEIPNEISLAVNISGCPNRCPGCHSPWLWENEGKEMTTELLSGIIGQYSAAITCFCFMGGDADPSEIQRLSLWIRTAYPHLKTAWYSGRESIPDGFDIKCLDYLKLGPYVEALGGLKSPTTNQALYHVLQDGSLEKCSII
jgi:anaerobic ribonucleoside-triphosphate reductase activating protein